MRKILLLITLIIGLLFLGYKYYNLYLLLDVSDYKKTIILNDLYDYKLIQPSGKNTSYGYLKDKRYNYIRFDYEKINSTTFSKTYPILYENIERHEYYDYVTSSGTLQYISYHYDIDESYKKIKYNKLKLNDNYLIKSNQISNGDYIYYTLKTKYDDMDKIYTGLNLDLINKLNNGDDSILVFDVTINNVAGINFVTKVRYKTKDIDKLNKKITNLNNKLNKEKVNNQEVINKINTLYQKKDKVAIKKIFNQYNVKYLPDSSLYRNITLLKEEFEKRLRYYENKYKNLEK